MLYACIVSGLQPLHPPAPPLILPSAPPTLVRPDLFICVTDPHRVGHESRYYPGDVCFRQAETGGAVHVERMTGAGVGVPGAQLRLSTVGVPERLQAAPCCRLADAIVINKANTAPHGSIDKLKDAAEEINPGAKVGGLLGPLAAHTGQLQQLAKWAEGGKSSCDRLEAACHSPLLFKLFDAARSTSPTATSWWTTQSSSRVRTGEYATYAGWAAGRAAELAQHTVRLPSSSGPAPLAQPWAGTLAGLPSCLGGQRSTGVECVTCPLPSPLPLQASGWCWLRMGPRSPTVAWPTGLARCACGKPAGHAQQRLQVPLYRVDAGMAAACISSADQHVL